MSVKVAVGVDLGASSLKAAIRHPDGSLSIVKGWPNEKQNNSERGTRIEADAKTLNLHINGPNKIFFGYSPDGSGTRGFKLSLDHDTPEYGEQELAMEFRRMREDNHLESLDLLTDLFKTTKGTVETYLGQHLDEQNAEINWFVTVPNIWTQADKLSETIQGLYRRAAQAAGFERYEIESEGECNAQWLLHTFDGAIIDTWNVLSPKRPISLLVVDVGGMTTVSAHAYPLEGSHYSHFLLGLYYARGRIR